MTDQMWDDPRPTYRPNWRDRRDMAARRGREAAESDAGAGRVSAQGSDAEDGSERHAEP